MRRDDVIDEVTVFDRDTKSELPEGWRWSSIGELTRVIRGASPRPAGDPRFFGGIEVPWITVGSITGDSKVYLDSTAEFLTEEGRLKSRYVEPGTLLLTNSGATLGVPKITRIGGCINDGSVALLDVDNPLKLYLFYLLKSKTERLRNIRQGAAQPNLNTGIVKAIPVPLAPEREQHRIVSKIEELFSDLDAGVAALERAKANLKRYRASVLKAAVEGRLTTDWRAANPDIEPASELLKHILTTRRQTWEADQLAKYKATSSNLPKNWKHKYKEPDGPDTTEIGELPEGWCWASVPQLAESCLGKMLDGKKHNKGERLPYLRNANVQWRNIDTENLHLMYFNSDEDERFGLRSGDVLVCEGGEPGRAAVWLEQIPNMRFQKALHRVRCTDGLLPNFLVLVLEFLAKSGRLEKFFTGSTIKHFTGVSFAKMPLPLPPVAEQKQIVQSVDQAISAIERAERECQLELIRVARLRQSILQQAFEGKLVHQDPEDESATILLDRIRSERDKLEKVSKTKPKKKGPQNMSRERIAIRIVIEKYPQGVTPAVVFADAGLNGEDLNDIDQFYVELDALEKARHIEVLRPAPNAVIVKPRKK